MHTWEFPDSQWLGLSALTAGAPGSIPGWGTKILQAAWCGKKKKMYICLNYFSRIKEGWKKEEG